jgi:hypothetical protein
LTAVSSSVAKIGAELLLADNPLLAQLDLAQLTQVAGTTFRVSGHPLLAQCVVDQLYAQLQTFIGWTYWVGNDLTAACGG